VRNAVADRAPYFALQEARIAVLKERYKDIRLDEPDPEDVKPPKPPKPTRYRVLCVETGEKFRYVKDAAAWLGKCPSLIGQAMQSGIAAGGYHFRDLKYPHTWPEIKPRHSHQVVCIDTGATYPSGFVAAKTLLGISDSYDRRLHSASMAIYRACKEGRLAFRMRWRRT
jgi:hypothetical protein